MISRRLFLIGSASFVAAASAPALLAPDRPVISTAVLSDLPYREIIDLTFGFEPASDERGNLRDVLGTIDLFRSGEDEALHHLAMNLRGTYRWMAMPLGGIIVTKEAGLTIQVRPSFATANISMIYNVEPDRRKRRRLFAEDFAWRGAECLRSSGALPLDDAEDYDDERSANA